MQHDYMTRLMIQDHAQALDRYKAEQRREDLHVIIDPLIAAGVGILLALLAIWLTP